MLALSLLVVNEQPVYAASKGTVKSVAVTNLPAKTLTVAKGKSKTLNVKVAVSAKSVSTKIKVTVKNKKYVTAKVSGSKVVITGKKAGKTTVTIASKANSKKKVAIAVTVGTPVSGLKLSAKKVTTYVGKTTTLKATITNKKASNKNVVWKSNKTNVVTVSSKGVVTGKKAGTATITAVAADGSGKKASCTVTVKKSNSIASVTALDKYTLRVTLADAQKLAASKFKVAQKDYDRGTYGYNFAIESVLTSDNKNYYITLDKDSLDLGAKIRISVTGLTGTKGAVTKETVYSYGKKTYTSNTYKGIMKGERISDTVYAYATYSSTNNTYGTLSCAVSGLPSGLKITSRYATSVAIGGKPTKAGTYHAVFTFKDELGNTFKVTKTYLVYDTSTIQVYTPTDYVVLESDGTAYADAAIYAYGGSGSYTYSIVGSNTGFSAASYGYVYGYAKKAGTTKVSVKVTDKANTKLSKTVTVTINAVKGYTLSGTVKTADGKAMSNGKVIVTNTDPTTKYTTSTEAYINDGKYSVTVPAGTYKIAVQNAYNTNYEYQYIGTQKVSGNTTKNLKTAFYAVSIAENDTTNYNDDWYDAKNTYIGYGDTLYLKAGTYKLHQEGSTFLGTYTATVNVTVKNKSVTVKPTVTVKKDTDVATVKADKEFSAKLGSGYTYFAFTPTTSGTYYFYNTTSADMSLYICNSAGTTLSYTSCYDYDNDYYYTSCELTAGKTYYLKARCYDADDDDTYTVKFKVSTTNPAPDVSDDAVG
jgi:hypothetical protein